MLLMTKSDIAQNFEYWKFERQVSFHNMHFSFWKVDILIESYEKLHIILFHINVMQIDVHLFM